MIFPILLTSIVTLALILEGIWVIKRSRRRLTQHQLNPGLEPGKGDLFSSLLSWMRSRPEAEKAEQEQACARIFQTQERHTSWLAVIAAISPLLGLLGTVSGMIQIFSIVAVTRPTNPIAELSRGISEALFATAGGLLVALLAAIGNHYLINSLDDLGDAVLDWLGSRTHREAPRAGK